MFIIDSSDSDSARQDLLLHTELPSVVEVEEDVEDDVGDGVEDDVGVWVEVDDEVPLHVSLLKTLPKELEAKQNLSKMFVKSKALL